MEGELEEGESELERGESVRGEMEERKDRAAIGIREESALAVDP